MITINKELFYKFESITVDHLTHKGQTAYKVTLTKHLDGKKISSIGDTPDQAVRIILGTMR